MTDKRRIGFAIAAGCAIAIAVVVLRHTSPPAPPRHVGEPLANRTARPVENAPVPAPTQLAAPSVAPVLPPQTPRAMLRAGDGARGAKPRDNRAAAAPLAPSPPARQPV